MDPSTSLRSGWQAQGLRFFLKPATLPEGGENFKSSKTPQLALF